MPTPTIAAPSFAAPDPDQPCSKHFRYRDLVQCGETWTRLASTAAPCANLPQQPETWVGLQQLAQAILDPLCEQFWPLELTYGFAGPALTRHIPGRIAPALDQHAGSELNRAGRLVCARRGQACDVRVAGVAATDVARFIAQNLPFDRLYLYGDDRPLHVSIGPDDSRAVYRLELLASGRRVPRRVLGW